MKMTAVKRLSYGGKRYRAGETLNVSSRDARLLKILGSICDYQEPLVSEQAVMSAEPPAMMTTPEAPASVPAPRARRTYQRRDIQGAK